MAESGGSGTVVRTARHADEEALREIWTVTQRAAFTHLVRPEVLAEMCRWPPAEVVREIFDGRLMLVAERDGVPVGLTNVVRGPDGAAMVGNLFVRPEAQAGGVGTLLLAAAVARLRELGMLGAGRVVLQHFTGNAPAGAFYAARGFREVERVAADGRLPERVWLELTVRAG